MWEDGCVMSQCPAHDTEVSTSHAAPPASDVAVSHPEQGLRRPGAPPAHFDEAQAEQALWQEFRDHSVSINNALTEVLWIHGGPSIWLFEVGVLHSTRGLFLVFFSFECSLICIFSPRPRLLLAEAGGPGASKIRPPRLAELRARLVPGAVRRP
jgi:hypothetical protein